MPVPTSYSELLLAEYLVNVLGPVADVLGWDGDSVQVNEAVADAVLDSRSPGIASVTDIRGLRALGRRAIWRAVVQATAGYYAFTDVAQQQFSRQQVNDQARKMLEMAETECQEWNPGYAASMVRIVHPNDPYQVIPDEERTP